MAAPDAPIPPGDGTPVALGMFVAWNADPHLPGDVTDKITVSSATFHLDHLQVVGDAGADQRTTHADYALTWDATTAPTQESFPNAPVGVYSRVNLVMSNSFGEFAYEIHGTWKDDDGDVVAFSISDHAMLSTSFSCDETLPAAGSTTLAIKVNLKDALNAINFKGLKGDPIVIIGASGPNPVLNNFRDRLMGAFRIDS